MNAIEKDLLPDGLETIGAHRITQRQQRRAERPARQPGDDLPAHITLQRRSDDVARLFKRYVHRSQ